MPRQVKEHVRVLWPVFSPVLCAMLFWSVGDHQQRKRPNRSGWVSCVLHGGAGNRTRVRKCFRYGFYVCVPPIEVSRRWPVGRPRRDKSP